MAADVALMQSIAAVPTVLAVCARATDMGVVGIARVTRDRWITCAILDRIGFGLRPGDELPVETTLCATMNDIRKPIIIENVAEDRAYCDHPTPARYGYQSHISVPIVLPGGDFFGTLLAIDPAPRRIAEPDIVGTFTLLADLLGMQIEAARKLRESQARLEEAQREGELREQFIAVLGHDLRNPLAAIDAGTRLLAHEGVGRGGERVLSLMQASVARMAGLVDDVLDFARGRLGGGLPTSMAEAVDLVPVLHQILAELGSIHAERVMEVEIGPLAPLRCDALRIGQMLSNLVANALTHGAADRPIRVGAALRDGVLELSVANAGEPIPPEALERLFQPFARGPGHGSADGLGLGLYIADQIARAHGGTLRAESGAGGSRFTFTMPAAEAAEGAEPAVRMASAG